MKILNIIDKTSTTGKQDRVCIYCVLWVYVDKTTLRADQHVIGLSIFAFSCKKGDI